MPDTKQAVQPQKMARSLKVRILEVEELYYLSSENKGADQLRVYRGFRIIMQKSGFLTIRRIIMNFIFLTHKSAS